MTSVTGVCARADGRVASTSLAWTTPTMSSRPRPVTGKREWPVTAAFCTRSASVAVAGTAITSTRGTSTSAAVRPVKRMARVNRRTSLSARSRVSADERISRPSSASERAWPPSSWGVMPMRRSTALAEPFRKRISGARTRLHARSGPASALAVPSGLSMAMPLGISSPPTICSTVATTRAITSETRWPPVSPIPSPVNTGFEHVADRRLDHEADDDAHDRDAELGPRELEAQLAQAPQHPAGPPVAVVGQPLDAAPVDGDEPELARDVGRVHQHQQDDGPDAEERVDGRRD